MPGMVGLITRRPRQWAEPQLRRMLEGLHREPFYAAGTWIDEALGVYVGWTSLQTSASSAMPTTNEAGDVSLVFSGQEYSCGRDGASSIVRLYEEDSKFPDGLNGVFHGLVADRRNGTALVFNDRYGMHRLCYHESKEAFYFAAEAKAILRVRPETRVPCLKSLGEFVACSCVLEDRTIFEGIQVLPGGSAWMFRNGSLERRTAYFSPDEWEGQDALDPQSYHEALRGALVSSLPRAILPGRNKLGSLLRGRDGHKGDSGRPTGRSVWRRSRMPRSLCSLDAPSRPTAGSLRATRPCRSQKSLAPGSRVRGSGGPLSEART